MQVIPPPVNAIPLLPYIDNYKIDKLIVSQYNEETADVP